MRHALLRGEQALCARSAAREVAEALRGEGSAAGWEGLDGSLGYGSAGLALACAYFDRSWPGEGFDAAAKAFLEHAAAWLAANASSPSLHRGYLGSAWVSEHLRGRLFLADGEEPNAEVDAALTELLAAGDWRGDYDLFNGLVGWAVYALERRDRCPQQAERWLASIATLLERSAERHGSKRTWWTGPELLPPEARELGGHYNLGLAHGVPGAVALLGALAGAGPGRPLTEELLAGAVAWLMTQRSDASEASCFPSWAGPGVPRDDSPLAWCNGDLGVAVALVAAARGAGVAEWEGMGLEIARAAAGRAGDASVEDAGLCHGAAGVGHVFNRLWQATDNPPLRAAAEYWFRVALSQREERFRFGGFPSILLAGPEVAPTKVDDASFLKGAAGVALALLGASSTMEPAWDRVLLLSTLGRGGISAGSRGS